MKKLVYFGLLGLAAQSAVAALDPFTSGNSSVVFIAFDNQSSNGSRVGSVVVDLGMNLSDFAPSVTGASQFQAQDNFGGNIAKVVWNFNQNTIAVEGDGITWSGSARNDFSAFASFVNHVDDPFRWAVIAGDSTGTSFNQAYLTTGLPTASRLTLQNGAATSGMAGVNGLFEAVNAYAPTSTPSMQPIDNGSIAAFDASAPYYVPKIENFGTNWQNKLKWDSTVLADAEQTRTNFWYVDAYGSEWAVGQGLSFAAYDSPDFLNHKGTWTLDKGAGTLTWATTVPEPHAYALGLVAWVVMLAQRRRRA